MSRLRKLMEERGLDVGLLGAALNISDSEMEEIVDKDDLRPLDEVIGELARVFDMDVEDLI
ncbi:helix-turn-helix domain-containing protein [Peptostreptococcus stomatis]|uniref:helix-turn-helix domain-containing protein n=1 Tax=Peptostreptococcus stomatis TaxID=341694 RepID=UPI0028D2A848|nr:helix-turn-helix domain-containing protein [Peptostreptococcus stomatis]